MKARVLAIAALTAATLHAARAQEVIPEVPPDATAPGTGAPPAEASPTPAEPAPPPAEPAPQPSEPAAAPPMPLPPAAAVTPAFGAEGQLVVSIDLPFMNDGPQFGIWHQTSTMNGPSSTTIVVQPSVDYFVSPSFSIGAELGFEHVWTSNLQAPGGFYAASSSGGSTVSVEARVGYDVPVTDTVSVWPRLGLGYTYTSTSYPFGPAVTGHSIPLSLTVPFLWHPGGHFFLGAGPALITQLVNKSGGTSVARTTDYGITALIGGTIGGR